MKDNNKNNRKIKVLHLLTSNKYSGAENVACTIIGNSSNEFEMAYCSPNGEVKKNVESFGIKYIPLTKMSILEINKIIKEYKPDIIHAHDYKASCFSAMLAKNCKVISHIHSNSTIMNFLNLKTLLYKIVSKKFQKIIWVSDSSLDNYYFYDAVKDKSIVLYNVIDNDKNGKKAKLYKCEKEFDIIFLGRLVNQKNPQRLIEVIKMVKNKYKALKVAIVGDGIERENVENLVKEYKLQKNITFYGFQDNPYPILKNSKIMLMTSIYEGTPMCALEALSFGIPIVSTPVDGLKKIIENGYNGFLYENNEEISAAILDILNDDKLLKKLSNNSKKYFKEMNDLSQYIEIINKIYIEKK